MVAKKKPKAASRPIVTAEQRKRIQKAFNNVEAKLVRNYKNLNVKSKDLNRETKKLKTNIKKARKRVEAEVKKNPAGATAAAAILGALAGAILVSKLRKKR